MFKTLRRAYANARNPFLRYAPPGHFYSPIPSPDDVVRPLDVPRTLPGIDARDEAQLALLARHRAPAFAEQPSPESRYYSRQAMFVVADAIALTTILREARPAQVLEIGSGFSSAVMLDTNDRDLGGSLRCRFVEPYPQRLRALLRPDDLRKHTLIETPIQRLSIDMLTDLDANDVLFIDSSHVLKHGSDVVYLIRDVLPRLRPGVLVHIHDIFWPFDYPEAWLRQGRAWNEAYAVQALLQWSARYEIVLFNDYLGRFHRDAMDPRAVANPGGSLWLRVTDRR